MGEKTKKQLILEAAAVLFRDKGYPATSMRDLARAVNLQASSLYNHISSKQDILREICFGNARRFLLGIDHIEQHHRSATDRVAALIELHIQIATEDVTSITAFNDEWRHLEEPALTRFREWRKQYEARFRRIIEEGMENGEFRAGDPQITLYTVLSSLRWVYDWYGPNRRVSSGKLSESIINIIMGGLRRGDAKN